MSLKEQDLSTTRAIQAAAFESISVPVVVCDDSGVVLVVNRALRVLLDLQHDAPMPSRLSDLPFCRRDDDQGTIGFRADNSDYLFGERTLRATSSPLIDDDEHLLGRVIALRDVSAEVAVQADVMRFIAAMSHELGKSLTPISGNIDMLLRGYVGSLSDEQTDMLQQARQWASRLHTVVRNTVAVASLEANQVQVELEPLSLSHAVKEALASLKGGFAAKNINIQVDLPDGLPDILADSTQLRQVLTQLLENARRFTLDGSVMISARSEGDVVRVDITDTGIGIPQEEQARLFSRFHWILRGDNAERGSGLGLYIVHQLVERQGGHIWLERSSEKGSMFSFVMPIAHTT